MGCTDSVQSDKPKQLSPYKLNKGVMPLDIQLKILRITLEMKKMKIQGSLSRNIWELQKMLRQPVRNRSKLIEYQKIQQCTWIKNETHIYGVIIDYLKVLQQYKHFLKDPKLILQLKPAITNILYAKQAINSDQLEQFCAAILKQYPSLIETPNQQDKFIIPDEITAHHRNDRIPTAKMINEFVMQFCNETQDGITLSVINATENNFHYD